MYSQTDLDQINAMIRRRWIVTILPAAAVLVIAVIIFVYGQINRSDVLWMVTTALTLLGGGYFLFLYGVSVRPARIYRCHVQYMLGGRMRVTTGVFKSFSEDVSDRDGLECHALMLNVGDKDDPEDDRLFYMDIYKPRPSMELGTKVTIHSNDKMVASMETV